MHFHPPNMPVVKYFRLNGINFTYCWRAGCTSIAQLAKDNDAKELPEAPEICMLLLKNPIERFRSSHMILAQEKRMNNTTGLYEIVQPPISEYLDGTLDDVEGVRSPHTWRQIDQHKAVKHLQLFRLEGTTHLADVKLPHLNKTTFPKPVISDLPRYPELFDFYAKDIEAWERAKPLIGV
jgi:hypothetical protein